MRENCSVRVRERENTEREYGESERETVSERMNKRQRKIYRERENNE